LFFTGAFRDFLVDNGGNATSTVGTNASSLIANLTITYVLTPQIAIYAAGRNLTNSNYEPVNGYAYPGASFLAGTRINF
jgi:outer membrane cobalamin receptor